MKRTRESLERELNQLKINLNRLEEQRAKFGIRAPTDLLNEIDETRKRIAQVKKQLCSTLPTRHEPSPHPPLPPGEIESSKRQIERPSQIQVGDVSGSKGVVVGQNIFQFIFSHASTVLLVLIPFSVVVVVLLAAIAGVIIIPKLKFGPTATPTKTPKPPPVAVVLAGPPTATATNAPTPTPTRTPLPEARKLYYLLILDASSRMADGFEGSDNKWMAAQKSARDLLTVGLPSRANYGLIVLGGNQPGSTQTCDDSNQTTMPLGLDQRRAVIEKIESLEPQGVASLTDAVALARDQLLDLPGDLEKTIFVITGGGDTCQPGDEWESLLDLLELSVDLIKAKVDLIILADENVDEEVQAAVREIIRLDLENVRADVPSNEEELTNTMGDVADNAVERARVVEPAAIAAEETAVAADRPTAIAVVPTPTPLPKPPPPTPTRGTTTAARPLTPTATESPTPIHTPTYTPTPTKTALPPTNTPTTTPTNTPTSKPTATPSPSPSITLTSSPSATPTPTAPPITLTPLPPQNDAYAQNCPLLGQTAGFYKFESNEATISVSLVSGGHTDQGLRLDFTALNLPNSYSGWEVVLGDINNGIDLTPYNSLTFYIRGAAGGETPNVWLMTPIAGGGYRRYYQNVEDHIVGNDRVTTQWQEVVIPLVDFTTGTKPEEKIDLQHINKIQIVFEWYEEPTSGTINIDDLCVQ